MTLIDSADSILMLYSYAGFPKRTLAIFEATRSAADPALQISNRDPAISETQPTAEKSVHPGAATLMKVAQDQQVKLNLMSGLSIVLTLMSILVAFRYSTACLHCPPPPLCSPFWTVSPSLLLWA
jgi:high-affinity nickel-transport protein